MRTTTTILVALLGFAVGACKSGRDSAASTKVAEPPAETIVPALPAVATASSTMLPDGKPPQLVLIVDGDGSMHLAAGPKSWAWFNTGDLRARSRPVDAKRARYTLKEARALDQDGEEVMRRWNEPSDLDIQLADPTTDPYEDRYDDPPPPEPEDEEDDGEETGGTGTAMALEEGKMGKHDSDRAEGQYKMVRTDPDLELHRRAAKRGSCAYGGLDLQNATSPERQCGVIGDVMAEGKLDRDAYSVMLAAPEAKAAPLLEVLDTIDVIGVTVAGKVRILRLALGEHRDRADVTEADHWIEVRIGATGLEVEAVPDTAQKIAWAPGSGLDGAALARAYDAAIAARALDHDYAVDILVAPETDMQHVVDVIAALDAAGAKVIGLGKAPQSGSDQAKLRGARIPHVAIAASEDPLAAAHADLVACYATLIASRPDAVGEVTVSFQLKKGTAKNVVVKGLDPALETCVATAVGKVKFPTSNNSLQVNATYSMSN